MNYTTFPTKGERTRAHIIETASGLFWRRNFHGVSMDEVASATGVNKATIYRYFADKHDLARAVTQHHGALALTDLFGANFKRYKAPDARLAAIYRLLHFTQAAILKEEGDTYGCPLVAMALELGGNMPEIRSDVQRVFDAIESYMCDVATDGLAATGRQDSPDKLARTLVQLLHGASVSARLASDPSLILDGGRASLSLIGFPDTPIIIEEGLQ